MKTTDVMRNKQKEIVKLLITFRFLTTTQVQQLCNHKDPHRVKEWLKELREKKYINTRERKPSFNEQNKPTIYYVTPKGIRALQEERRNMHIKRVYQEERRGETFVQQCVTIGDMYLFFLSQKKDDETIRFFTQSSLVGYNYFPHPLPNAYIVVKNPKGIKRYFFDIFNSYTPSFVFRKRVRTYLAYKRSGKWEAHTNNETFPMILFVCPSEKTKQHTLLYAKTRWIKECEKNILMFITTKDALTKNENKRWEKVT